MSAAIVVELEPIGTAPPSLNAVGSRGHWARFHRHKKAWQAYVGTALLIERPKLRGLPASRIEASATIAFTTRRRRDEGNFRTLLEKATGDALTEGGWLEDDDVDRFKFGDVALVVEDDLGMPEVRIRLSLE